MSAILRSRHPVWTTPEVAAESLGVSLWTVRRMLRDGQLRGRKLKSGRWQVLASGLRKDGGG